MSDDQRMFVIVLVALLFITLWGMDRAFEMGKAIGRVECIDPRTDKA